jgi:biotin carboxyl carrier protein
MPDEATPTAAPNAGLDDLERRLASFESATKRLGRTVGSIAEPGHASPPRPATRRLSESGAPRGEEISGLRPAVASQGPQTGALTARSRNANGPTPGFTSAFGKPSIPAVAPGVQTTTTHTTRGIRKPRPQWHWMILGAGLALLLGLLLLPRLFPVLGDAAVWAESHAVMASGAGVIQSLPVRVGDQVTRGQVLTRIGTVDVPSPIDGTIARLLVAPGARVAIGETLLEVALPETRRVVVALPVNVQPAIGDQVRIELLGERRVIDGNVELVLAAGAAGPWQGGGASPRRAVIQPAPSPLPLSLGQGARITVVGSSAGRRLLHALREMLPW